MSIGRVENWVKVVLIFFCFIIIMTTIDSVFIYLDNKDKSLYENCLDKCSFFRAENKLVCLESCNSIFKEVALDFMNKTESVLREVVNKQQEAKG